MKKLFTSILMMVGISIFSQPVLQFANVPGPGLSGTVFIGPKPSSPGPTGAGVTFNFSSLTFTPAGIATTTQVANTPYASSFPTANWAAVISSTIFGTSYVYMNLQSSTFEQIGNNITATGGSTYTPNPKTELVFPFNYTNSFTDSYQCAGCATGTVTRTYDAYGTLLINGKTYNNVVRVTAFFGGASYYYNYYLSNPVISFYSYDSGGSSSSYIELPGTAAGIENEISLGGLSLFPNPANTFITIANLNSFSVSYEVKDVIGKTVIQKQNISELSENVIDLSYLNKGIYFVNCVNEKGNVSVLKLVVE